MSQLPAHVSHVGLHASSIRYNWGYWWYRLQGECGMLQNVRIPNVLHPLLECHSESVGQPPHELPMEPQPEACVKGSFHFIHEVCRWFFSEWVNPYPDVHPAEQCY